MNGNSSFAANLVVHRLEQPGESVAPGPAFVYDDEQPCDASNAWGGIEAVILARGDEARAQLLLQAGAPCVLLGQAALADAECVRLLAQVFGSERVGVYAPVQRMAVRWSMDRVSNADFICMTPSHCEPGWDVLSADGRPTGTSASWWLGAMFERGAGRALVRAAGGDDNDLNILAGLVEAWGDRIWLAPEGKERLEEWVRYGRARRLVLPSGLIAADPQLLTLLQGALPAQEVA